MKITYIGHSCFKLEKDGYKLVIDPYKSGMVPGLQDVHEEANMVLSSHDHEDHSAVEQVKIVDGDVECPFKITEIETYHDECKGEKRGKNKIFIIEDGDCKLVHFGDLGCDIEFELDKEDLQKIMNPDVAMIPVGGKYTIDGSGAAVLLKLINPRIAIPMHFRSAKHGFGLDDISTRRDFTALLPSVIEHRRSWIDTDTDGQFQVNVLMPTNFVK